MEVSEHFDQFVCLQIEQGNKPVLIACNQKLHAETEVDADHSSLRYLFVEQRLQILDQICLQVKNPDVAIAVAHKEVRAEKACARNLAKVLFFGRLQMLE